MIAPYLFLLDISYKSEFSIVQVNTDNIVTWVDSQHMSFNTKKYKFVAISWKLIRCLPDEQLTLMKISIERVSTFKYL